MRPWPQCLPFFFVSCLPRGIKAVDVPLHSGHALAASLVKAPITAALSNPPDLIAVASLQGTWAVHSQENWPHPHFMSPHCFWKTGSSSEIISYALHWNQRHLRYHPALHHGVTSVVQKSSLSRVQGVVAARLLSWCLVHCLQVTPCCLPYF